MLIQLGKTTLSDSLISSNGIISGILWFPCDNCFKLGLLEKFDIWITDLMKLKEGLQ
jgi:hypothetical protein